MHAFPKKRSTRLLVFFYLQHCCLINSPLPGDGVIGNRPLSIPESLYEYY